MVVDLEVEVPSNPTHEEGEIKVGEVRYILQKIIIEANLSSSEAGPSKQFLMC